MAVRGGVVAVVGFGLDDAAAHAVYQHQQADQPARHHRGIGCEIDASQQRGRRRLSGGKGFVRSHPADFAGGSRYG